LLIPSRSITNMATTGDSCFWLADFLESSPLKPFGQMNQRTFHRCFLPSFGSFGQAVSEDKNFTNQPIRNKSHLWWQCLLMDRDEMSNRLLIPSRSITNMATTGDSCFWLADFLESSPLKPFGQMNHNLVGSIFKSANQKQESPVVAMFANGSGRNEQSLQRTFHRCFLPSFGSFG
jgi:hypothetical protein